MLKILLQPLPASWLRKIATTGIAHIEACFSVDFHKKIRDTRLRIGLSKETIRTKQYIFKLQFFKNLQNGLGSCNKIF